MRTAAKSSVDILGGNIYRNMFIFALPLIASGVLQQSFNSVDVAVVGRFVGHQALAAVGSNGPVINLIVNLFLGISVGANVVIANYIGRANHEGVRRSVATATALAAVSGALLLVLGECVAVPILVALGTPDEVLGEAVTYLRIYSLGMPFMMVYNFGSAILRSFGDTRRPFYALVAGGIVNVVLNLFFVLVCGMGVAGVAVATVVANGVSATVIYIVLSREQDPCRVSLRHMSLRHGGELGKILRIGVPAGIQGMVFSFSYVFIQSAINSFGADAMAGSAAALNYELYGYFVINAFAQSVVAFTGQNNGAGNLKRCSEVLRAGLIMSFAVSLCFDLAVGFFADEAVSVFTTVPAVISYAVIRVHCGAAFQFIACSYEMAGASLRGQGYSMTPTVITIVGTCLLRLGWVMVIAARGGSFMELLAIYPISWAVTGVAMLAARSFVTRRLIHGAA